MTTIDERIVKIQFENDGFRKGVSETISSIDNLKTSLGLDGIASGVQNISEKFGAFGAIAFSALNTLTNAAIGFGNKIAGAILDPLVEGGKRRALNIEQAKFQFKGLGIDVEKAMEQALYAVKGTAFGLDEAAKAAANLGASQVPIEKFGVALRAISGVAALSGSSYSDIADVFTKVAGQGRLMGDDLNRLASRGVNAAATLAKSMNLTEMEVRKMVGEGKVSFEMFAKLMDDSFGEHATKASETYSGAMANVRAALSRIGASVATSQFERLRKIFVAVTPIIDQMHEVLKPLFKTIDNILGPQTNNLVAFLEKIDLTPLIKSLEPLNDALFNIAKFMQRVSRAVTTSFTDIFPAASFKDIFNFAKAFEKFTENLIISSEVFNDLKRTLRGAFAIFGIAFELIKALGEVIFDLLGFTLAGTGGILKFTGNLGDFIFGIYEAIKSGDKFTNFFSAIASVIKVPIALIKSLIGFIGGLVLGISELASVALGKLSGKINDSFDPLLDTGGFLASVWDRAISAFDAFIEFIKPATDFIVGIFSKIGDAVGNAFKDANYNSILDTLNTGLFATIVLLIKQFFEKGLNIDLAGGFVDSIKSIFGTLTGTLKNLQDSLRAKTILTIAGALALLTASVIALSLVDPVKLATAMAALTAMFFQLGIALKVFESMTMNAAGFSSLTKTAAGLVLMGVAINVFVTALIRLSKLEWADLIKGLAGLNAVLGSIVIFTKFAEATKGSVRSAFSLILLGTAINILAMAVSAFSELSVGKLTQGLLALTAVLTIVTIFNKVNANGKALVGTAFGMVIMATSLVIFAEAVSKFGSLDWETLSRGLVGMAASLLIVIGAMKIMPTNIIFTAFGLVVLATSLTILAKALEIMGGMSWEEVAKSLVVMATSLAILAGALYLFNGTIAGSVALAIAAGALALLAPVIRSLGEMSWEDIGRGLTVLGASLLIIAGAGVLLTAAVPGLLGFGAAVLLFGLGALSAGIGLSLMAAGLTALAAASVVGTAALISMVTAMIGLIPLIAVKLAEGFIAILGVIAKSGEAIIEAFVTIILAFVTAIAKTAPVIIDTLFDLIMQMIDKLETAIPRFVEAGLHILNGILKGIADNIGELINQGTRIVVNYIKGISEALPKVIQAGFELVISFINGLADAIRKNTKKIQDAGRNLASAIIDGVTSGLFGGVTEVWKAAENLGDQALKAIKEALGIKSPSKAFMEVGKQSSQGLAKGLSKFANLAEKEAANVGNGAIDSLKKSVSDISTVASGEIDMNPTIRPVLDLSDIRKKSASINGMLPSSNISVGASYSKASSISESEKANRLELEAKEESVITPGETNISFVQNNTSPKSLSASEIYRQTRNQISAVKGVMSLA